MKWKKSESSSDPSGFRLVFFFFYYQFSLRFFVFSASRLENIALQFIESKFTLVRKEVRKKKNRLFRIT